LGRGEMKKRNVARLLPEGGRWLKSRMCYQRKAQKEKRGGGRNERGPQAGHFLFIKGIQVKKTKVD